MINSQSSRRSFLGSLAILSAGSAFGSVARLVPETPATNLYREWKRFCWQNGGQMCRLILPPAANLPLCKGHWYKTGETIAFPQHNLLVQPTWIFWSETKNQPADIVITLFKNDAAKTRLARLNRFEWEGLLSLPAVEEPQDVIALMKESYKPTDRSKNSSATAVLKVAVRKGRDVSITARLPQKQVTINKQFLYSI